MAIELQFRKGRRMTLDWLTDASLFGVQLHGPLDLERGGIRGVTGDAN